MKKLKPLFVILTTALILFSAVCFLYPAISNAINEQYNESRIDDYNHNVDSISQEDISAHCGYPTQKFFDDIDELENGDEIYIYVLDRTLKYSVIGTDVVEPDDSSRLEVVQRKDLLTLVTCTPYGVNSHRLLVHAERAPFEAATSDSATVSQVTRTVPKSHQLQIIIAGLDFLNSLSPEQKAAALVHLSMQVASQQGSAENA